MTKNDVIKLLKQDYSSDINWTDVIYLIGKYYYKLNPPEPLKEGQNESLSSTRR